MMRFGLTLLCVWAFSHAAHAVTILGYNSAQFDRFASGYATSPVPNISTSFIGAAYDFSGVGWSAGNPQQSFTMINDQYFMGAAHYMPSAGSTINFYSPTLHSVVSYTVDSYTFRAGPLSPFTAESGDLAIGRLTTAISSADGIAAYPILNLGSFSAYAGLPLLIYGHAGAGGTSPSIGTNILDDFYAIDLGGNLIDDSIDYAYDFNNTSGPTGEAYVQSGDSGSPTFVSWYGQLALLGTHSAIGKINESDPLNSSFDNFAAIYLDQIATAGISVHTVPEPSRMLLLLVSMGALVFVRRR